MSALRWCVGDAYWPVRKVIRYILVLVAMHRKALTENDGSVFEILGLQTQKSPQGLCCKSFNDFDDGSGNHQSGKYSPESLISLTRSDEQSSGTHEPWFPKVQARNQTHIFS